MAGPGHPIFGPNVTIPRRPGVNHFLNILVNVRSRATRHLEERPVLPPIITFPIGLASPSSSNNNALVQAPTPFSTGNTTNRLSTLPEEVLLNILQYLVVASDPIIAPYVDKALTFFFANIELTTPPPPASKTDVRILRVSKLFYRLGLDVLYKCNTIGLCDKLVSPTRFHHQISLTDVIKWLSTDVTQYRSDGSSGISIRRTRLLSNLLIQHTNVDSMTDAAAGIAPARGRNLWYFMQRLPEICGPLKFLYMFGCNLQHLTFTFDEDSLVTMRMFADLLPIAWSGSDAFTVRQMTIHGVSEAMANSSALVGGAPNPARGLMTWMAETGITAEKIDLTGSFTQQAALPSRDLLVQSYTIENGQMTINWKRQSA